MMLIIHLCFLKHICSIHTRNEKLYVELSLWDDFVSVLLTPQMKKSMAVNLSTHLLYKTSIFSLEKARNKGINFQDYQPFFFDHRELSFF